MFPPPRSAAGGAAPDTEDAGREAGIASQKRQPIEVADMDAAALDAKQAVLLEAGEQAADGLDGSYNFV